MTLSNKRFNISFMYLILITLSNLGCASNLKSTKFDGKWELMQKHPFDEQKACLSLEDLKKLRATLVRCEQKED